ncbi:uncharacterized protein LOC125112441 [Phacochoerus africanus]|uniref:uncharacterized protein LOC125112441 n=1 Tax=Phacochoerus africanus TaxID=41426 RepID=UPI001FDA17E6|nr:uncharacterized protein LOC125112441 [Phacochoerus africanus]
MDPECLISWMFAWWGQDGGAKLGSERRAATCPRPGHAGQSLGPATGSAGALAAGGASERRAPAPPGGLSASLQAQPRPARPAHPRRAPSRSPRRRPLPFVTRRGGLGLQGLENEPLAPCALSSGALAADSGSAGHRGPFFFFSFFVAFQDFLFRVALRHGQGCQHSRFGIEPSDSANTFEGKPPFALAPRLPRPGAKSGWQGQVAHKGGLKEDFSQRPVRLLIMFIPTSPKEEGDKGSYKFMT